MNRPRAPRRATTPATSTPTASTPLLTLKAAAAHFDVHPRTVRRWIEAGDLAAVRIGSVVRIRSADLDAFISAHLQQARPVTSSATPRRPNKSVKSKVMK
ncbi:MAG: helix-turn-helix domain-containing protein [Rhodospirillales bacterium]